MNHYASVYQKDYTWPHAKRVCQPKPPIQLPTITKSCNCTDSQVVKALLNVSHGESFDWSRACPMGRLLEAKVYPTKCTLEIPEARRFDQPHSCLGEFETCCPEPYVPKPPWNGINALVEAERLKTTYQVDYSDPATKRMEFDIPSRITDMTGQQLQCCKIPIKITIEADCQPRHHHPHLSRGTIKACNGQSARKYEYKRKNGLKRDRKCDDIENRQLHLPVWRTEYRDTINKIGQTIMRANLHHAKKAIVPVWTTSS